VLPDGLIVLFGLAPAPPVVLPSMELRSWWNFHPCRRTTTSRTCGTPTRGAAASALHPRLVRVRRWSREPELKRVLLMQASYPVLSLGCGTTAPLQRRSMKTKSSAAR